MDSLCCMGLLPKDAIQLGVCRWGQLTNTLILDNLTRKDNINARAIERMTRNDRDQARNEMMLLGNRNNEKSNVRVSTTFTMQRHMDLAN